MLDLCILLPPSRVHRTSRHRQRTNGQTSPRTSPRTIGRMHTRMHAPHACAWYSHRTLARTLAHRSAAPPPFRPWSPSRGSIGWFGLPSRDDDPRNALSLLAFALPLPCLALPRLPCPALPSPPSSPVLHVLFFSCSSLARSPNSYRPARRVLAQFCLIFFLSLYPTVYASPTIRSPPLLLLLLLLPLLLLPHIPLPTSCPRNTTHTRLYIESFFALSQPNALVALVCFSAAAFLFHIMHT